MCLSYFSGFLSYSMDLMYLTYLLTAMKDFVSLQHYVLSSLLRKQVFCFFADVNAIEHARHLGRQLEIWMWCLDVIVAIPAGFFSKLFGGSDSSSATPSSSAGGIAQSEPVKSSSENVKMPSLKVIKTPHEDPISHPELAFTPSDIGIWEINKGEPISNLNLHLQPTA